MVRGGKLHTVDAVSPLAVPCHEVTQLGNRGGAASIGEAAIMGMRRA